MNEFVEKLIEELEKSKKVLEGEATKEMMVNGHTLDFENLNGGVGAVKCIITLVKHLAEEYNNGWISFTQREMTEEEKEVYGEDLEYMLDCKLPDDGEEIIVCYKNGYVDTDTFIRDTDGCYLDSGNDFIDDVIAWMPLPAPYQKGE